MDYIGRYRIFGIPKISAFEREQCRHMVRSVMTFGAQSMATLAAQAIFGRAGRCCGTLGLVLAMVNWERVVGRGL
jgi:hypothetical protein